MTAARTQAQIVLCGLGGQGVVFLSRVVAGAALLDGSDVLAAETHGMAQRGGAVEAHVKVGAFESSLVRRGRGDLVLALDASRIEAARAMAAPDGIVVASARSPTTGVETVDAAAAARSLEHPRGANLVLLGFAVGRAPDRLPSPPAVLAALERLSPKASQPANRRAFEYGINLA